MDNKGSTGDVYRCLPAAQTAGQYHLRLRRCRPAGGGGHRPAGALADRPEQAPQHALRHGHAHSHPHLHPDATSTPTETPTITPTATLTATATPSAPFVYTVQEGDSLAAIVEKFALGDDGIPLILMLNPYSEDRRRLASIPTTQIVYPGQQIFIPNPDLKLPTATPIPPNLPKGTIS